MKTFKNFIKTYGFLLIGTFFSAITAIFPIHSVTLVACLIIAIVTWLTGIVTLKIKYHIDKIDIGVITSLAFAITFTGLMVHYSSDSIMFYVYMILTLSCLLGMSILGYIYFN